MAVDEANERHEDIATVSVAYMYTHNCDAQYSKPHTKGLAFITCRGKPLVSGEV